MGWVRPGFICYLCFRWKCDGCSGFVIGTRFNCNACTDLDLCLGCYTASTWPDR
jgi:hypothetical protein